MKYPFEIAEVIRKTKTFAVDARFTKCESEKPLKVFDDTFSRFVMTILSEKNAATCNIPVEQIAYMDAATNYAFRQQMEAGSVVGGTTPAFTERFRTGKLKDKSPAEVLVENYDAGKKLLNEQYEFLKKNLEKYPANKKLMDAIMDAAKLSAEDLEQTVGNASAPITILNIDCRPLIRKTREDGKCFCYEEKIVWNTTQKYPVCVEIKNYYAPVKKNEDGTLNVSLKDKDASTEMDFTFNMSAQEWMYVMDQMKQAKDNFVTINFAKAINIAEEADREAREAKEKPGN